MAASAASKTGFEKWQDGIAKAVGNSKWHAWDCEIQMAVNEYNHHLAGTAGYSRLDWRFIKAMVWVESGAESAEWNIKPMRIGVPGDPGMTSLLSGNEGGDLILPPDWKRRLTTGSVRSIPAHNIRAGIGFLLMKMANYEYRNTPGNDLSVYEVTVKPLDSLAKIAKAEGSTIGMLKKLNPTAAVLRPGQVLKCQKASIQRVVTGWRPISTALIAHRYNGGGDALYAIKLDYTLSLVRKGKAVVCAQ